MLAGYDNALEVIIEGGYIRVVQDIRGKYGSEGDYVMNRPLRGPQNPTPVDHATDTYDTIDWLVKNTPGEQRQGRHPRHFLRRVPAADGAGQSAPGAQGVGADEPDGRRLDGRRLVPQRRVPAAEHAVHLRAGGHARQRSEVVDQPFRRLRHVHAGRIGRRSRTPARPRAGRLLAEDPRASRLRRVLARSGRRQGARRAAADRADDDRAQPVGSGGHLRRDRRLQGDQAEGHRQRQGVPGRMGRGITARRFATAAASARSSSTATRRSISGARSCGRSSTTT